MQNYSNRLWKKIILILLTVLVLSISLPLLFVTSEIFLGIFIMLSHLSIRLLEILAIIYTISQIMILYSKEPKNNLFLKSINISYLITRPVIRYIRRYNLFSRAPCNTLVLLSIWFIIIFLKLLTYIIATSYIIAAFSGSNCKTFYTNNITKAFHSTSK